MTFDSNESGAETGQPIELYEFRVGVSRELRTSSENDIEIPSTGEVYQAIVIERNDLVIEINNATKLEIRLPASDDFVSQFLDVAPGERATVTLFRMHRGDLGGSDEMITAYKGTVRTVGFTDDGRVAVLNTLPLTSAYSRIIPRRTYQNLCNHMLFDSLCTLDKDDPSFRHDGNVSAVSGDTITVDGAAAFNALPDFFEAGYVEFDGDFRTVVSQSGDDLTLIAPFKASPLGSTVTARAGCKHRIAEDCRDKFSNADNFGGFPYVPTKNPFSTGLD